MVGMNEIICPHCKKAFQVDEAGFADILSQVRTREFESELHERIAMLEREKQNEVKLTEEKTRNEVQKGIGRQGRKAGFVAGFSASRPSQVIRRGSEEVC
jgi:hypothetical protein